MRDWKDKALDKCISMVGPGSTVADHLISGMITPEVYLRSRQ